MGMDSVEIIMCAEEEFEITISDADASQITTVHEFAVCIASTVNAHPLREITVEKAEAWVIDLLVDQYDLDRAAITPDSRFAEDSAWTDPRDFPQLHLLATRCRRRVCRVRGA